MSTPSPSLSVILVTFNSAAVLRTTLQSVRELLPGTSVIVVDNGSTDATVELARALDPAVRIVDGHGNVGFGAGVNLGVRAARTSHVLVLNPDAPLAQTDPVLLTAALGRVPFGVLVAHEKSGATMRPLIVPRYSWPVELLWSLLAWFVVPAEIHLGRPSMPWSQRRFSGAAFVVQIEEFLRGGGFDEQLFLYHEDEELSLDYALRALPIEASTALVVTHDEGTSSPRSAPERIFAWKLLSAVQAIDTRHGARAAGRATFWTVIGLRAVVGVAKAARPLPVVGNRARRKAESAFAVLTHLAAESAAPPRAGVYEQSRELFLRRLR